MADEEAEFQAKVFAGLENRSAYILSNPLTLISFAAPKASFKIVNLDLFAFKL